MASLQVRRLLDEYLIGDEQPNGDYDARCPLHDDKTRSCRINFEKNVWHCFAGCGSGNLSGLLKRMRAQGLVRENTTSGNMRERRPSRKRPGRVASISPKLINSWHESLLTNDSILERLWSLRDIRESTVRDRRIGWDQARQAFSIPIYLESGRLFNVRMYRPDAPSDKKIFWFHKKPANVRVPMYPMDQINEDWLILCEGELDALVAIQNGFPAISGTAGAGTWHVDWSEKFKGKQVFIAYDRDSTGERGAKMVSENLEPFASAIYVVRIPINKKGADVTDFFLKGNDAEDFKRVLRKAELYQKRIKDPMEMQPIKVSVLNSFDSRNIGRAQSMEVLIAGRAKAQYALPKVVLSKCTMDAGPKCKMCPMLGREGEHRFEIAPSDPALLEMMDAPNSSKKEALRKVVGAMKCDRLTHEEQTHQTIEQLYVRPSWDEVSGDFTPRMISSVGKHDTMPSQVVEITGTTWPDPKRQSNEFLAWNVAESEDAIDEFKVTPDIVSDLRQFRPERGQSPLHKLGEIAEDMQNHVTRIYGRREVHMLVDLTFMSITGFPFQQKIESRGWLDVLIIGDTRTGKSEVSRRMIEHYGTGQFISCESATFAGIMGGAQRVGDNQWTITWGIVPMSDRRLVVLDEAGSLSKEEIAKMSEIRSSGIARMQMIQAEQAQARTRLLWLSNPRNERMSRYTYGVQAIPSLIGNREDIARFDLAMALTSRDVNIREIQKRPFRGQAVYSAEDCHKRVLWAWSRKPENVIWEDGVEKVVLRAAKWLGERYIPEPPLIQIENAHIKVARVAVALASAVFSTDRSGKNIIVKHEHVRDATKLIHHLYSMDTFGYDSISGREIRNDQLYTGNSPQVKSYLLENRQLLDYLMNSPGQVRREVIEQVMNVSREEATAIIHRFYMWGMAINNGTNIMKIQPRMQDILREIEREEL